MVVRSEKITGQSARTTVEVMARGLHNRNISELCQNINVSLQAVSDDLQPLNASLIPPAQVCPADYIIYPYEVESKLSKLDPSKACGPDDLPNWFLRDFAVWLSEPVAAIYNASLCEGVVPRQWKL